ncbi:pyruvate dehydrogenase complex dihydrolipoyllysine-residue acetyltransferase [Neptunomonas japonica]|uniref:Acetyltransferase component of pyruvate dehydrogenase complex n=1 Tax=Neptunomonas japonica JAMM 1380 TaxID=1441457 RepID=A0A7R6SUT9_9GAMM|nr:pyruvate dehydrogenase complex dihydrolipoyllysine-residue acetyltransferase [Neptunomonas japonica]BBB28859.1 pyruvate dehydrogenase E2 component (dihydrolipoamide acetyltransferase) [Neptunomonas japonica JAMM 1380]
MSTITITVPDLSGAEDVDVIEVLVKAGDVVAEGDSLMALETDKASMEVPAEQAGTVVEVMINEGDTCNEGDVILTLSTDTAEVAAPVAAPVEAAPVAAAPAPAAVAAPTATSIEQVLVPDLSGAADVDVIEVMVKPGDVIEEGDSLIALETDKASMEVPAPMGGKVVEVKISEGGTCSEGDLLVLLEVGSSTAPTAAPVAAPAPAASAPVAAPAAPVAGGVEDVLVPDLSGATDVDVIEVMVKPGDVIAEGDSLIALETDKASMEVPAPKGGTVKEVKITEGSTCNEGDVLIVLEVAGSVAPVSAPVAAAPASAPAAPAPVASPAAPAPAVNQVDLEKKNRKINAGPAVRAVAREYGVDLSEVKGNGRNGRVLKEDVQAYVKSALKQLKEKPVAAAVTGGSGIPAIPAVDFSKFGEIEKVKLSKIGKLTAANMSRCWLNIPHVTQFDDADITELEAFRKGMKEEALKAGVKLTPLPFMIKAVAKALAENPKFNASLDADGEHVVYKKYINIGLAVDTPNGLMVPVIKDADKKSIYELSLEANELAGKAKDRKLKPNEMQGACFTISSLGGIGGTGFTPIVNAPEVGILGVSKADIKPRWNGKEFEPRMMLPLCLSYDHRAINGGDAGRFLTYLNSLLSDIRRLML